MLRRQRQRVYRRSGKSHKYLQIKEAFDEAFLKAVHKYKDKVIEEVTEGKRGSAYKAIKKLADNKTTDENFQIPAHVEANLSPQQCAESLADYFSQISQEFDPINMNRFSPKLKEELLGPSPPPPHLEEHQIYRKILSSKKPNSMVPGDLPRKVVKEFAVELSKPMETIFNAISTKAEYPRQWIIEAFTTLKQTLVVKEDRETNWG